MLFDVTTHPLLSLAALALLAGEAGAFEASGSAAETLLGITADDLGVASAQDIPAPIREKGRLAVVRQLARDLAVPADAAGVQTERRGERTVSYFAGRYDQTSALDPQAALLAAAVRLALLGDGTAPAETAEFVIVGNTR